jgi:hypothetical protein
MDNEKLMLTEDELRILAGLDQAREAVFGDGS